MGGGETGEEWAEQCFGVGLEEGQGTQGVKATEGLPWGNGGGSGEEGAGFRGVHRSSD